MNPDIERQICFLRSFPTDPYLVEKQREIYKKVYNESCNDLHYFRNELYQAEENFIGSKYDLERWRAEQTNQHIKLLEAVINAKRNLEWSKKTLREVVDEKILFLTDQLGKMPIEI